MSDHLSLADLVARWKRATEGQLPSGTVKTLVLRTGGGNHVTAQRLALDPRSGISGDRWSQGDDPDPDDQLSLIDSRVVEALVDGDPARLHVPGDNVVVDFDLGAEACPFGTRLRVGTAVVELSGKLHAGCKKFRARLGDDALRWVNAKENRPYRLRGVYARIVEPGEVTLGDRVVRVGG